MQLFDVFVVLSQAHKQMQMKDGRKFNSCCLLALKLHYCPSILYWAPLSYGKKGHTLFLEKLGVLWKVRSWKPLLSLDVKNYWNFGTGRHFVVLIQHDMCFKLCSWQLIVKQRQMVSFPFECSAKGMEVTFPLSLRGNEKKLNSLPPLASNFSFPFSRCFLNTLLENSLQLRF